MSVRVRAGWGEFYAVSGMTFAWTALVVKVKNLAYAKDVDLHYRVGSQWRVQPLVWLAGFGSYDIFGGAGNTSIPACSEFAVRYQVGAMEFWDNNAGWNYTVSTYRGVVGGAVGLKRATARLGIEAGAGMTFETEWIEGEIYVANLSYQKRVGLVYSRDGGLHWETVEAGYQGPEHGVAADIAGVEIWKFKTPVLNRTPAAEYRFAVFYETRDPGLGWGTTYWDNCFGGDYRLPKVDGQTLE
jgi:hypothetical protein